MPKQLKKQRNIISQIGVILGYVGLAMGAFGIYMFFDNKRRPEFVEDIGKFCFLYCFAFFLGGLLLSFYPNKK